MEIVRYADRPDLREVRTEVLEATFPAFMHHNAMGKYWGRLYDDFPDFQLALLDDGDLVAEVHSAAGGTSMPTCRAAGTTRSSAAWSSATANVAVARSRSACARTGGQRGSRSA